MASVRKRTWTTAEGEGKSAWIVDYKDQFGKRRHKQFDRKKDADEFRRRSEDEVHHGVHTPDRQTATLGTACSLWLTECEARHDRDELSGYALRSYRYTAVGHVLPALGSLKLNGHRIRPQLQAFIDGKAKEDKPGTLRAIRAVINQTLKHAAERDLMNYYPLRDRPLRLPPARQRQIDIPTKEETNRLLAVLAQRPDRMREITYRNAILAILIGLFSPAMRRGEICALWWENIDWDNDEINVTHNYSQHDGRKRTKTRAGLRRIPMLPPLRAALLQHAEARGDAMTGYVLVDGDGAPVKPDIVTTIYWHRICRKADLLKESPRSPEKGGYWGDGLVPKYHFHALRHFCASILIEQGIDPYRLMKVMGHNDIKVTYNVYGHMFPNDQTVRDKLVAGMSPFTVPKIEDTTSVIKLTARKANGRQQVAALRAQGKNTSEIARQLGVQRAQVYAWDEPDATAERQVKVKERDQKILALHEQGHSMAEIDRMLRVTTALVWSRMIVHGHTAEHGRTRIAERDAKILALRAAGATLKEIGKAVGRSATAVHWRLKQHQRNTATDSVEKI